MLPSMPILFTRDSQDAFGNKIEPSTSFFNQNCSSPPVILPRFQPPPQQVALQVAKVAPKEAKSKPSAKKKVDPPKIDDNALETALVRSYYTKVQSRFSSNTSVPTNKFVQFQSILKSFDPSKETPVDLYKKIENLFGEHHKDIVEEFLLFLKPGQAAEIGRFMDRVMLVQITGFIEMLQRSFARKPTVLRKVVRAMSSGVSSGGSSGGAADVRARVLPHLRSNPRLANAFKLLFPDERPPDSLYETGTDIINESFLTCDKGYDVWEFQEESDNKKKLDAKESLDTVYLHGRVFLQHGRLLRSACVTYPYSKEPYRVQARRLAPTHTHLSPPNSEDERASPKRNAKNNPKIPTKKAKKQLKSPTKNVKDVNDNTKHKDCAVSVMSPKANKKSQSTNKTKSLKKDGDSKDSVQKRERKDSKTHIVQKKDEGSKPKQPKIETAVVIEPRKVEKGSSWTRDEDKTMLQVLKGEASSEQVFGRIRELLPHRSATEIKERFCHVMTLLQQMAVGEVT